MAGVEWNGPGDLGTWGPDLVPSIAISYNPSSNPQLRSADQLISAVTPGSASASFIDVRAVGGTSRCETIKKGAWF